MRPVLKLETAPRLLPVFYSKPSGQENGEKIVVERYARYSILTREHIFP